MVQTRRPGYLLCSAALLSVSAVASAQDAPAVATATGASVESAPSDGLGDIVVTARRRAESLQNVPVAVIAISKAQLQNNNATDLNKVAELAPQVIIGRGISGTGAVITIRGISSSTSDSGLDQSVAISFDNVPLSRGRIIAASLFDMQQVEILQGPQALFFGKNSPAGVISMTSADPTDKFEASVRAGYEFVANERFIEGVISGPISDTLKARFAFRTDWMDGWIKNISTPIANPFQPSAPLPGALGDTSGPAGHDYAGRATWLWTPQEGFDAKLKVMVDQQRLNSDGAFSEPFCTGTQTVPTILGVPEPLADCKKNRIKSETAFPNALVTNYPFGVGGKPFATSKFELVSLNMNKAFGAVTLTSTSGFYNQKVASSANADYSDFIQIFSANRETYRVLTQEFRVNSEFSGPLDFMAGMYFEHADRFFHNAPDLLNAFNPVAQNYATNVQKSNSNNDSFSVFAQLRWTIVPGLELDGGARYSIDDKRTAFVNEINNLAGATGRGLYPQGLTLVNSYHGTNVSPEVTLTWHPAEGQMLYGAYKTGYKAGGVSNPALLQASATSTSLLFGSEKAKGYEIGYKADFFDRTLRFDLTGYRYNYDGLQVTSFDSILFRYKVGNAAKARTTGVTGTFKWLATDNLTFDGNLGYNKAKYLSFPNAQCFTAQTIAQGCIAATQQDLSGKALNRAPKWSYNIGANYRAKVFAAWTADFSISGAYTGSYEAQTDYGPGGQQDSFWRLNAAIHLTPPSERFDVALIGRNLTNSYYLVSSTNQPLGSATQYVGVFNRPREVVLQAQYRF